MYLDECGRILREGSYVEYLVGEFGGRLKVPGDERSLGRVSTDGIGAAHELSAAAQKQDVQCLLNRGFIHVQHLRHTERLSVLSKGSWEGSGIRLTLRQRASQALTSELKPPLRNTSGSEGRGATQVTLKPFSI